MSEINQVTVEGVTYDIEDEVARQGVTDLYEYIDSHGSVQSDWDQNDETAADYVKNRSVYKGEVEGPSYTFSHDGSNDYHDVRSLNYYLPKGYADVEELTVMFDSEPVTLHKLVQQGTIFMVDEPTNNAKGYGYNQNTLQIIAIFYTGLEGEHILTMPSVNKIIGRSDWDNNDSESYGYIENRTHYSAEDWHSSPEVNLNLNNQDGSQGFSRGYYYSPSPVIATINESLVSTRFFDNLHVGEGLKIVFDNQEYDSEVDYNSSRQIMIRAYVDNISTGSVLLDFRTNADLYDNPGYGDELNFLDNVNFNPDYISNGTHTLSFQRNSKYVAKFLSESYLQGRIIRHGSAPGAEVFNNVSNTATGQYSHAEGHRTTASGSGSHAEGGMTTASGDSSHAEGRGTTASELYSHAEGYHTTASGQHSHAEGQGTTASGHASHAEGDNTTASGEYSHAEGQRTKAFDTNSHAEGLDTTASGNASHAEGTGTHSTGDNSHVQGKWNKYRDTAGISLNFADVVGNGSDDNNRSNAYTLDWGGNGWFAGKVTAGAAPVDDMDLTTKKFVEDKIAALEARISALENA